jgi:hypothetical protein
MMSFRILGVQLDRLFGVGLRRVTAKHQNDASSKNDNAALLNSSHTMADP